MSFRLESAEFIPAESAHGMAAIRVKGISTSGTPFEGVASLEMDGRDADWEGTSFGDEEFEELWGPLLTDIDGDLYKTPAWKEAEAWYELSCARTCWTCNREDLDDIEVVHEVNVCKECREGKCHTCGAPATKAERIWGACPDVPDAPPEGADARRYACDTHAQDIFDNWLSEYLPVDEG